MRIQTCCLVMHSGGPSGCFANFRSSMVRKVMDLSIQPCRGRRSNKCR